MDGELLAPHELVNELRDELLRVLVGPVDVVTPRYDDREVERPDLTHASVEFGDGRPLTRGRLNTLDRCRFSSHTVGPKTVSADC